MRKLERLACRHEYERQSVYVDDAEVLRKCRKCGKRVREAGTVGRSPS
jgi:hypothetical protein